MYKSIKLAVQVVLYACRLTICVENVFCCSNGLEIVPLSETKEQEVELAISTNALKRLTQDLPENKVVDLTLSISAYLRKTSRSQLATAVERLYLWEPLITLFAMRNKTEWVTCLLETKLWGKDEKDSGGLTALHWAVYHENLDMVIQLIGYGAAPNEQDNLGRTPLRWAVDFRDQTIADFLILNGALDDIPDSKGITPKDRRPRIYRRSNDSSSAKDHTRDTKLSGML